MSEIVKRFNKKNISTSAVKYATFTALVGIILCDAELVLAAFDGVASVTEIKKEGIEMVDAVYGGGVIGAAGLYTVFGPGDLKTRGLISGLGLAICGLVMKFGKNFYGID